LIARLLFIINPFLDKKDKWHKAIPYYGSFCFQLDKDFLMTKKPTYEELEQRVEELEKEVLTCEGSVNVLNVAHSQFLNIFESIDQPIHINDPDSYELLFVNEAFKKVWGDATGHKCYEVFHELDSPCSFCPNDQIFGEKTGQPYIWEFKSRETGRTFHRIDKAIRWTDGRMVCFDMAIDITAYKQVEEALRKHEAELEIQSDQFQEVNSALKVLLKQREEDKKELQENVVANLEELVFPYLKKLSDGKLDDRQRAYFEIIQSNLNDIISPFIGGLSSKFMKLTPTEVQVANFIKHGKNTKDIADALNLSAETIKFHRKNIREKIGIKNKKANLRTYLLSIQ
jgi:DNA-binding NarL/FixJ family response regulator